MRSCFGTVYGDAAACFVLRRSGSSFGSAKTPSLKNDGAQSYKYFHREHMTSK